jgi:small subunit ribosomal protein S9
MELDTVVVEERKPIKDKLGRSYATGRRKSSVSRCWIKPGKGVIVVNKRAFEDYFTRPTHRMIIAQPFEATNNVGSFDIICTVSGGGMSGQAGALRLAISRALVNFDPSVHYVLRSQGFLTRDSRVVERKKFGHKKARKSFQFSKR